MPNHESHHENQSTLKIGSYYYWRAFVSSNEGEPGSQPMLNLAEETFVLVGGNWQPASSSGWTFTRAEKVNNSNWIVAYGVKNGITYALVLSPK